MPSHTNVFIQGEFLMSKYIFVTGGVISALGKGITAASVGLILKRRGFSIRLQKFDPYVNVDPGTMNPFQHGEVYVTEDGTEADLDLGHYERYTGEYTSRHSNYTTGKIYSTVIEKERKGDFLGNTVQVIPHITDEIKNSVRRLSGPDVDIVISEIGGTVGDIESLPFLEAIRQMRHDEGDENVFYMHVTLVPYIRAAGELKTKPTQQSVSKLREIGIIPDALIIRCEQPINDGIRKKISLFCNVSTEAVIQEMDVSHSIYEIPQVLVNQSLDGLISRKLKLLPKPLDMKDWDEMLDSIRNPEGDVKIAMVGKYSNLVDAYKSIFESLDHAGFVHRHRVQIDLINAEELEKNGAGKLENADGIVVPGGFGTRGIEGKIIAIRFAREKRIPFLGLCLGMQCAVIEFARNVLGLKQANSAEFDSETPDPVIALLDEQRNVVQMGGTMRLGSYPCVIKPDTRVYKAYGASEISERHRHRYEFNIGYRERFIEKGMIFSGTSPDGKLVEMVELADHPWFVATQAHPEFKSRPIKAHPLFREFIRAAIDRTTGEGS